VPQPLCANNEEAPNHLLALEYEVSIELFSLTIIIPYSTNIPADPNLWDSGFAATSLFGTNEFLQSNVQNMACSLQQMASFLKQRNFKGCNSMRPKIKQISQLHTPKLELR